MRFPVKTALFVFIWLLIFIFYAISPTSPKKERRIGKPPKVEEYRDSETAVRKSPPVISSIGGGLGNQLFQYAAAYSVAKKRNSDLFVCVEENEVTVKTMTSSHTSGHRKYSLNKFNIPQNRLLFTRPSEYFNWNRLDAIECGIDYYLNGKKVEHYFADEEDVFAGYLPDNEVLRLGSYFESEAFFASDKSDILNLFQPTFDTRPIEHLKLLISSAENSVSVHIRRRDFSHQHDFRLISLSYQREAMQLIKQKLQTKNVTFFVFTDDLDYVKKHLDDGQNHIIYMSDHTEDNTLYDFVLMSLCKHNIITNSSFSWWAAYLNKNLHKIVVAPMPRYKKEWIDAYYPNDYGKKMITELAYPKGWLTIAPKFLNYTDHE